MAGDAAAGGLVLLETNKAQLTALQAEVQAQLRGNSMASSLADLGPTLDEPEDSGAFYPRSKTLDLTSMRRSLAASSGEVLPSLKSKTEVADVVYNYLVRCLALLFGLERKQLRPTTKTADLGLSSQNVVEMKNTVAEGLCIVIPTTLFFENPTLGELADSLVTLYFTSKATASISSPNRSPKSSRHLGADLSASPRRTPSAYSRGSPRSRRSVAASVVLSSSSSPPSIRNSPSPTSSPSPSSSPSPFPSITSTDEALALLGSLLRQHFPHTAAVVLTPDFVISQLGLVSQDVVRIKTLLADDHGIIIPVASLFAVTTVGDLAALVVSSSPSLSLSASSLPSISPSPSSSSSSSPPAASSSPAGGSPSDEKPPRSPQSSRLRTSSDFLAGSTSESSSSSNLSTASPSSGDLTECAPPVETFRTRLTLRGFGGAADNRTLEFVQQSRCLSSAEIKAWLVQQVNPDNTGEGEPFTSTDLQLFDGTSYLPAVDRWTLPAFLPEQLFAVAKPLLSIRSTSVAPGALPTAVADKSQKLLAKIGKARAKPKDFLKYLVAVYPLYSPVLGDRKLAAASDLQSLAGLTSSEMCFMLSIELRTSLPLILFLDAKTIGALATSLATFFLEHDRRKLGIGPSELSHLVTELQSRLQQSRVPLHACVSWLLKILLLTCPSAPADLTTHSDLSQPPALAKELHAAKANIALHLGFELTSALSFFQAATIAQMLTALKETRASPAARRARSTSVKSRRRGQVSPR